MEAIEDFEGPAKRPEPTKAIPGSAEKVDVFCRRAMAGEDLFHDGDAIGAIHRRGMPGTRGRRRPKSSKYAGVYRGRWAWIAQIKVNGQVKHLGSFRTEAAAYRAFKEARGKE